MKPEWGPQTVGAGEPDQALVRVVMLREQMPLRPMTQRSVPPDA